VANGDKCCINNCFDNVCTPHSAETIVRTTIALIGQEGYQFRTMNCEHFTTFCRYGFCWSVQGYCLAIIGFIGFLLYILVIFAARYYNIGYDWKSALLTPSVYTFPLVMIYAALDIFMQCVSVIIIAIAIQVRMDESRHWANYIFYLNRIILFCIQAWYTKMFPRPCNVVGTILLSGIFDVAIFKNIPGGMVTSITIFLMSVTEYAVYSFIGYYSLENFIYIFAVYATASLFIFIIAKRFRNVSYTLISIEVLKPLVLMINPAMADGDFQSTSKHYIYIYIYIFN
jgi:hypothetical protein